MPRPRHLDHTSTSAEKSFGLLRVPGFGTLRAHARTASGLLREPRDFLVGSYSGTAPRDPRDACLRPPFCRLQDLSLPGAARRTFLYDLRILRDSTLGVQVIAVGNLTVGGTGKTPVVEKFARELRDQGRNVAILSRGYRSKPAPVHQWLLEQAPFP